ncbi:efflux RND transporter periplasmic adaptor subunit [Poriferisphaera sp. WC338]|uniref:efflux RND transporter periplasmic adaptor subunit n=1 Tax=Poriferisphaera sp. WC338 TaxID=3425129 RepID=UPI003D8197B9
MSSLLRPRLAAIMITGLLTICIYIPGCSDEASRSSHHSDAEAVTSAAHTHENDETCFICDASKRDAGRLWCKEHARYEDRCWDCHSELEDKSRLYCKEHGLYEDECFLCHPEIKDTNTKAASDKSAALFCNEHGVAEIKCGICQPQLAESLAVGDSLKVRMKSPQSALLAGITHQKPSPSVVASSLDLLGEIRYNENRRAKVTPLASGVVAEVHVDVGESVKAGQVLAVVHSFGVAQAKSAYLSALAEVDVKTETYKRERRLVEDKLSATRNLQLAEAAYRLAELAVRQAHQQLLNLGFTESEVVQIKETLSSSSSLYVRAPFDGIVIGRNAVLGEAVESDALFEIADLSTMWIELAVPEEKAVHLVKGGEIVARLKSLPELKIEGEINWISPQINERTRMVRARAAVPNLNGILRHGMFTKVTAVVGTSIDAMVVPNKAIHRIDGSAFVFVKEQEDLYAVRRVEVGPAVSKQLASISEGITSADNIVTDGGFTMKTEFLKSRLGAGCVDH